MRKGRRTFFYLVSAWIFLIVIAILAPFLAGDQPVMVMRSRGLSFPLIEKRLLSWGLKVPGTSARATSVFKSEDTMFILNPLVPFEPLQPDYTSILRPPSFIKTGQGHARHPLGTDALGRDLLAGLLHATHHTLSLAFAAMTIALFLGTFLGVSAGYFGNTELRLPRPVWISVPLYLFAGWFWAFPAREAALHRSTQAGELIFTGQVLLSLTLWMLISLTMIFITFIITCRVFPKARRISVPLDDLIMKLVETLTVLPRLLVILALVPLFQSGWWWVVVILGLLSWTGIARLWRSGVLTHKNRDYVLAARAMGLPTPRLLLRHILPNTLGPVAVAVANGLGSIVLTEAALSFLGFGLAQETLTWGRLLMNARFYPEAWWLTVFPALCLAGFIALCNETARLLEQKNL